MLGKLRYMPAYDFGVDTPSQQELTDYALAHTGLVAVANSTSIVNLFDGHEWIYNEEGEEWVDLQLSTVGQATNTSLGVVKGSTDNGKISVDGVTGEMAVNISDWAKATRKPAYTASEIGVVELLARYGTGGESALLSDVYPGITDINIVTTPGFYRGESSYMANLPSAWSTTDPFYLIVLGQPAEHCECQIITSYIKESYAVYMRKRWGNKGETNDWGTWVLISYNNYSTTEQAIGTWIDGETIYRRVFRGVYSGSNTYRVEIGFTLDATELINVYGSIIYHTMGYKTMIGHCLREQNSSSMYQNAFVYYIKPRLTLSVLPQDTVTEAPYGLVVEYTKA